MLRFARIPQALCGIWRAPGRHRYRSEAGAWGVGRIVALAIAFAIAAGPPSAQARDPSLKTTPRGGTTTFAKPGKGLLPSTKIDKSQPLYLQGDKLVYDTPGNRVIARGNVEIYYNNYILTADEVIYDQSANTLSAIGNVVLKEPNGAVVRADRYTLTDDFRDGFVQSLSVVAGDDTKISASRASRREGNVTEFQDAKFTPCKTTDGVPPLWCISSKRIIHDKQDKTITYQDAAFEVFGNPILYMPYFQHADPSTKRKSGFLIPSFGQSGDLGFISEVPYFFALAPNYDFTFRPAYMSDQGVLWQGDWRHKLANGQYSITFAGIDQDGADLGTSIERQRSLDGFRGSIETAGRFSLSSWWQTGWDVTLETDDTFRRFYKLDSILVTDRVNEVFLRGKSDRNYFNASLYHFGGLLLQDTPQAESRVHPIIDHNYIFADPILGGELKWDTNILSFSRADSTIDGSPDQILNRAVTQFSWRRRFIDPLGITYTPFALARGDIYQFDNVVDPLTGELVAEDTEVRGLAAGGATVSYPWIATTSVASHTIEPIGQIIGRQESAENRRLPNEDAKSLVFDDTTLFEIDKFSGYDRVETGTRVNAGVQYTFQAHNGGYARLLAGQSFQISGDNAFRDPGFDADGDPVHTTESGLETSDSDYVVGAYIAPSDSFRIISQSRLDEDDLDLRRQDLFALAHYGPFQAYGTYAFVTSDPQRGVLTEDQDVSGGLAIQLTDRWSISGNMRYDLEDEFVLSDRVQIRYADECFALTARYQETFINDPARDIEPDRTVYLTFSFKHLGEFGYTTDVLDHVYGDDQPPR